MRRKRRKSARAGLFRQRGNIALYLLLGIVIVGAYFLAGGTSNFTNSPVDNTPVGEIIEETPAVERENLQLQNIRFKKCSNQLTVDLLLDVSGSMSYPTETRVSKIRRLKEAVLDLSNKLSDSSVIGIQTFRGTDSSGITDLVPISFYKDVKSTLLSKISSLSASGLTPTHNALAFSYGKLVNALPKFPDRKFNFILISDGAPCPGLGCTDNPLSKAGQDQDPRNFNPNPADQIKGLGVIVYTIGIYDQNQAKDLNLEKLLKDIASKPENYFDAKGGDAVKSLLNIISEKICSETN